MAEEETGERKWAGKFDSPEALEKSYQELQSKLGSQKTETSPAATDIFEKASLEYAANGQISAETRSKLHGFGVTDDYIETFTAGAEYKRTQKATELSALDKPFEGIDDNEFISWADSSLSDTEKTIFNETRAKVEAGQMTAEMGSLIMNNYVERFRQASENPAHGDSGGSAGVKPFESMDEFVAAQRKVYTLAMDDQIPLVNEIQARFKRSKELGKF